MTVPMGRALPAPRDATWRYRVTASGYRSECLQCGWLSGVKASKRSAQGAVAAHRCRTLFDAGAS